MATVAVGLDDQRMAALELANEVRSRRARLKRDLAAGRVDLRDLIVAPPWWLETAAVVEMLVAVRKVGRVKAGRVLTRHGLGPGRTFGGLSVRQRRELVEGLGRVHPFRGDGSSFVCECGRVVAG